MTIEDVGSVAVSELRRLSELIGRVTAGRTLEETLQAVVDGVVRGVGFGVAVLNLADPDGSFRTVAVAGSDDARRELLHATYPADTYDVEFDRGQLWGPLLFVPHDSFADGEHPASWVPQLAVVDHPDAWHPLDALFVPLRSASDELVGVLSVDLPNDGRRPGLLQRELLAVFAGQAGIAIHNARLTEQLLASERAFRLAFEGAGVGMAMIGLTEADAGRLLRVNDALCRIAGRSEQELVGHTCDELLEPDDARMLQSSRLLLGASPVERVEVRCRRPDGSVAWVAVTTSAITDSAGRPLYGIAQVEDVSDRRAAQQELAHRAVHDPLTGLPNRVALQERLNSAFDKVRRTGRAGAVLFCDLDGFKDVNDLLGHAAGDDVLAKVARRLAEQVRGGDTVARLGGDEFVILAEDITVREVRALAERIGPAVAEPVDHGGQSVGVTISIGIATLTESSSSPDHVLRQADAAMYAAKTSGRNSYAFAGPA